MKLLLSLLAALGVACGVGAQCNTVTISNYGVTCDFFGQSSVARGSFEPNNCSLTLGFSVSRTCCNTYAVGHVLMIGLRQLEPGVPNPLLLSNCRVAQDPILAIPIAQSTAPSWQVTLPLLAPITLYAQGLNDYFTTIGLNHDYQTSDGLKIEVR